MCAKSTNSDLSATIERLRKGKQEHLQAGKKVGHSCGVEWARNTADYQSLADVCEGAELDYETFDGLPGCNYEKVHTFGQVHGHEPDAFCEGFFEGFTDGAKSIWVQVEREI